MNGYKRITYVQTAVTELDTTPPVVALEATVYLEREDNGHWDAIRFDGLSRDKWQRFRRMEEAIANKRVLEKQDV